MLKAKTLATSGIALFEAKSALHLGTSAAGFQTLQVSLGGKSAPREMLTEMSPSEGKMSRLFNLYLNFIGRSQGYRGSAMSYSEFCSYHNSNYSSGPFCGDRGPFAVFDLEQPPGSIATDLQVRGQLLGDVKAAAKQRSQGMDYPFQLRAGHRTTAGASG